MKNLLFTLLFGAGLFVATSAGPLQAREEKVLICHVPPDNPANFKTIEVGAWSLDAHQAHSDWGIGIGCHQ
jgi:ABC-type sugar transport system substrate-binding protein